MKRNFAHCSFILLFYYNKLVYFIQVCRHLFRHSSFKVAQHFNQAVAWTGSLQHLHSFILSHSFGDLLLCLGLLSVASSSCSSVSCLTHKLTFDFRLLWFTEEFVIDVRKMCASLPNKSTSLPLHRHAWRLVRGVCCFYAPTGYYSTWHSALCVNNFTLVSSVQRKEDKVSEVLWFFQSNLFKPKSCGLVFFRQCGISSGSLPNKP